ncbi:hypothetical protein BHM03_00005489 [Ensete ventricosum]|nr:hypothetical protein BHM03_00005489 [Ensete ventricosum]
MCSSASTLTSPDFGVVKCHLTPLESAGTVTPAYPCHPHREYLLPITREYCGVRSPACAFPGCIGLVLGVKTNVRSTVPGIDGASFRWLSSWNDDTWGGLGAVGFGVRRWMESGCLVLLLFSSHATLSRIGVVTVLGQSFVDPHGACRERDDECRIH